MTLTKEELNKIARDYHDKDPFGDKFIEDACQFYTYDWVFKQIEGCKNVLELGYGEGNFTSELVKRNFIPTVVDGSDILLSEAVRLHGDKISVECCLFEEYNPVEKFDCILATHVLEHVDDPVLLLNKMKSWLNDSGRLVVIVPNKESIHRQLAVLLGLQSSLDSLSNRDLLVGHQRVYSLETLGRDFEQAGFQIIVKSGFFLKVLPNSMMLDYSNDLISALNSISEILPPSLLANIAIVGTKTN
jgi:2-polyprenyl-3-methyl-5-hydroxy-6-metoxy-1,4-benzoquinol methylase